MILGSKLFSESSRVGEGQYEPHSFVKDWKQKVKKAVDNLMEKRADLIILSVTILLFLFVMMSVVFLFPF